MDIYVKVKVKNFGLGINGLQKNFNTSGVSLGNQPGYEKVIAIRWADSSYSLIVVDTEQHKDVKVLPINDHNSLIKFWTEGQQERLTKYRNALRDRSDI
jgi:hypothetical protein